MLKLSSTSALVLLWAKYECYKSKAANCYLKQLDLAEGKNLYNKCNEICPYYDEVIINRKYGILNLIKESFATESSPIQLVIAGAGFDALGIEVRELYSNVKIFEIDIENMKTKSHLVMQQNNKSKHDIAFIEADISNTFGLYKSLCDHSWTPKIPTLLVLEGVSYYLSPESIQKLIQTIKPGFVIFEFLKQDDEISTDRIHIPNKVFELISDQCRLSNIIKYNYSKIGKIFNNFFVVDNYSMKKLELMRTGSNSYFETEDSGWIEIRLLTDNPYIKNQQMNL
ncbi:MAG: class I SAM-dependent methyltransferase [Bacteroidota bacterium]|nr:class I SAM-dependent methyltransferase [Bacteroidota bacterium]